jgi:hypothetical protein
MDHEQKFFKKILMKMEVMNHVIFHFHKISYN